MTSWPKENILYSEMREHIGHEVVCVCYGREGTDPVNVSIECEDCGCVIVSRDQYQDE